MLSFEAQQFQGTASIVEKLTGLPFTTIKHQIATMDAQPAATDKASMIVLVTGQLLVRLSLVIARPDSESRR